MNNKIALTLVAMIALSGAAMAQMNHQNTQTYHQNVNNQLNLTSDQQAKMKQLHESIRSENQTARDNRRTEMDKFYNNPTFNPDEAKRLAQKHRDERAVRKMKHRHSMNQILTPEQRKQHSNMMKRDNKRNKHNNNRNRNNNYDNSPRNFHNN